MLENYFLDSGCCLWIETRNRDLKVSVVSVTQTPDEKLVVRFGGEIKKLGDFFLQDWRKEFKSPLPILVPTKGYQAQQSAGFVKVKNTNNNHQRIVIGTQGMPWDKYKGLKVLKSPVNVAMLPSGSIAKKISTHTNHNAKTAQAAVAAVEIRGGLEENTLFILEGQSNLTRAFSIEIEEDFNGFSFSFPVEHRKDLFFKEERVEYDGVWYHRHPGHEYWHTSALIHKPGQNFFIPSKEKVRELDSIFNNQFFNFPIEEEK